MGISDQCLPRSFSWTSSEYNEDVINASTPSNNNINTVEQQPDIIQSKKTTCACGATVNKKGLKKHLQTKKHRKFVIL
jgi:hypothetical protein